MAHYKDRFGKTFFDLLIEIIIKSIGCIGYSKDMVINTGASVVIETVILR
jgi:hypothetical protein